MADGTRVLRVTEAGAAALEEVVRAVKGARGAGGISVRVGSEGMVVSLVGGAGRRSGGTGVRLMRVVSLANNHVMAKEWDPEAEEESGEAVAVAKPPTLRHGDGVLAGFTDWVAEASPDEGDEGNQAGATYDGSAVVLRVAPPYEVGSVLEVVEQPTGEIEGLDEAPNLIDLNQGGRAWGVW